MPNAIVVATTFNQCGTYIGPDHRVIAHPSPASKGRPGAGSPTAPQSTLLRSMAAAQPRAGFAMCFPRSRPTSHRTALTASQKPNGSLPGAAPCFLSNVRKSNGRRGGKDRVLSAVGWRAICCDWRKHISSGEQATVILLGADKRQADLAALLSRPFGKPLAGLWSRA